MRNRFRQALCVVVLAVTGATLLTSSAAATFHEISIREVYAGSSSQPGSQYVELQAWSAGQNFVAGHSLKTYDAVGNVTDTATFSALVPNGANQSTILLATPAVETEFGVVADEALAAGALSPAGGAACWEALDCVSWGSFSGPLPSPPGPPAAAIPDGMAVRRTISPGCATLLEAGDDHDNSAADFTPVFPAPRPNSVAPSERPCSRASGPQSEGPGGGKSGKQGAPQTTLLRKPPKRTADRSPTFRFRSDERGSSFQCKLDSRRFKSCRSPFTPKRLSLGPHTFRVRARDGSGKFDPTPASYSFKVIRKR